MKVSIIGGTGFIGGYIVDRLIAHGHQPRLLVRGGSEDNIPRREDCEIVSGDIFSRGAIDECVAESDALLYLVGILREFPGRGVTFEKMQYQGFAESFDAARNAGVGRVVLMSANGVDNAAVPYQRSKLKAERLLESEECDWTVFRPSVVFGDPRGRLEFCTQLKRQLIDPPLPASVFFPGVNLLAAGRQPMSPVYVGDVAEAFAACIDEPRSFGRTFALGGPRTLSWKEIIETIARASGKRGKLTLPVPAWGVKAVARLMERFAWFPLTADQITMLMQGNVADASEAFDLFGIEPTAFDEKALSYLARN
ncbi:MAG: NAD-dependent epimerase/dehydratase family protein [Proteobacteria bacterium]|nr:MAG: NAD-dependent epimerase/dehydratase family protein [Pseudomonadota bacterium]